MAVGSRDAKVGLFRGEVLRKVDVQMIAVRREKKEGCDREVPVLSRIRVWRLHRSAPQPRARFVQQAFELGIDAFPFQQHGGDGGDEFGLRLFEPAWPVGISASKTRS